MTEQIPCRIDKEIVSKVISGGLLFLAAWGLSAAPGLEYLSDNPELIVSSTQDWGVLGFDTAAHETGKAGAALQIGDRSFTKGIGHHANGAMVVLLDGAFTRFEAWVGVQPCGEKGSVIFRVSVDGQARFESGVMQGGDSAKPLQVDLAGAQELRLEASDAGDGINCDVANWAEARLTRASGAAATQPKEPPVDIGRFARVVTWDPDRLDGSRASRIEEFRAEDVFLETNVMADPAGVYLVPVSANGARCIGLQWLNPRSLKELGLEFDTPVNTPATNLFRVEGWFGESAWQGNWQPLAGALQVEGKRWTYRLATKGGLVQTQKIRWVFAGAQSPRVRRLTAFTRSRWETVKLVAELDDPPGAGTVSVGIHNGQILGPSPSAWPPAQPLHLTVRYSRKTSWNSDPTVLEFGFPSGGLGVAVEDVLSNDCVYVPDYKLFVARDPQPVTLADYKLRIAGRKTILEQVRELPEQSLEKAMAKTHHEAQREGPVMLSLACDNRKFVVERDGTVRFQAEASANDDWFATAGEVRPEFGGGKAENLTRELEGDWLPIPVIRVERNGVLYSERTFVAPTDEAGGSPGRLNRPSVCVSEFTITNSSSSAAEAALSLNLLGRSRPETPVLLKRCERGFLVLNQAAPIGLVTVPSSGMLECGAEGGRLTIRGNLLPRQSVMLTVYLPAQASDPLRLAETSVLRAATESHWNAVLAPAMQIETPDGLLNRLIRSSEVRCLIAARNEAEGKRVAPWIAAMSYGPLESEAQSVIRGMDFIGQGEFAQLGLDYFIHRYNTNGFLTTGYTTFGTPWHLWTLGEHWRLTRDEEWLRRVAPELKRVGLWLVRQTEKTRRPGAPESGLMPPGVLADWNAFAYHFVMSGYAHAALRELGNALGDIGDPEGSRFIRAAAQLRSDTERAYRWTQSQSPVQALSNGTWIPHPPSQVHSPGNLADFFPGQDAGRSWCYDVEVGAHQLVPVGILDPHAREVDRVMDHMEDVQFLADGWFDYPAKANHADWFNLGGFSKVQPYYARNCEVYAMRDEVKPFIRSYFNTIAAMLNPEVLSFWEHFHHSGAWDKTHETGYFLHQTRTLLVQERGQSLWLAPFAPGAWYRDGNRISVSNAPSFFGKVSFEIRSHLAQGFVEATIQSPKRRVPEAIVLGVRHPTGQPIRQATVDGVPVDSIDPQRGTVRVEPKLGQTVLVRVVF
jgi:hypothetical protein